MTAAPVSSSILVLGAGTLGLAVIAALAAHPRRPPGSTITVLVRSGPGANPDRAARLAALANVSLVRGDIALATEAELVRLFDPHDTVIACTGYAAAPASPGLLLKVARAALAAPGTTRFFPWAFGVDYDALGRGSAQGVLFDEQIAVRELLRGSAATATNATEWVVVAVGMFMDFLFAPWWGVVDVEGGALRALGAWGTRLTVTAPEDIGRAVAEIVFQDDDEHARGKRVGSGVVFVAGETLTYADVADAVERALGRPLRRELWTVERLRAELDADPDDGLRRYRLVFAGGEGAAARAIAWDHASSFNAERGLPTLGVEEWARRTLLPQRQQQAPSPSQKLQEREIVRG